MITLKRLAVAYSVIFILGLLLMSCAPKPTPSQAPTPPSAKAAGSVPQDENWAKVVEAAKREGVLNAYSWHLTGDQGAAMTSAFEKRYGIRVEAISGPGTQMIERIKTENAANQKSADVFTSAIQITSLAKDQGITQSVGDLPSLRGSPDKWRQSPIADPPDSHLVAFYTITYTAYVNTNRVPPGQEPRSFKDLLDPKWKGQIIEGDPASDPAPNATYYLFTSRNILTPEYFSSLAKQNLIIAPQYLEKLQMLSRGAGSIALSLDEQAVSTQIAKGAPIKAIALDEGIISLLGGSITMLAKASHPNAARLFIDWWLSPEGQETWGKASMATPILASVPSFVDPKARPEAKRIISATLQDIAAAAKVQSERTLAKIYLGQ